MTGRAANALAALCALALAACDACAERSEQVARLATTLGDVQRDFAAQSERWRPAGVGAAFEVGDGLRTGAGARAELELMPSGRLRVEADTVVRFARSPPGQQTSGRVELTAGAIELEAAAAELEITSASGRARVTPGSRMHVRAAPSELTFAVDVGRVLLEQEGHTRELRGGESFVLDVGALRVETQAAPPQGDRATAPDGGAPHAASVDAGAAAAAKSVRFDTPPARTDFELPAGESARVHDPDPPTHVRIAFAGCPDASALEVARAGGGHVTRVRGQRGGIVALPPGQFRYRVRCVQPSGALATRHAAEGRLQIVRDAATRKLKTAPPAVAVAADGRRYTVRYQNLLPQLSLQWPDAPQAGAYVLELREGAKLLLRERARSPQVTLASGRIDEGTYGFRFETGGKYSPESTLSIVFDDTARVAYLSEPRERAFAQGTKVRVEGAALRGAQVAVEGTPLLLRAQGRFETEVVAPADRDALAVRVQHPATGVHYFLRHAADAGE